MNDLVDVRKVLTAVRVPTLVLHRRQDAVVLVENGRYLAEHIPNAQLVELDGADHFVSGNPDQILDPVERFLRVPGRPGRRARWCWPPSSPPAGEGSQDALQAAGCRPAPGCAGPRSDDRGGGAVRRPGDRGPGRPPAVAHAAATSP